ncbi:MAG TPA: hypothetical protein VLA61_05435 [Ideonella sp.]|uniref:hypothetical protein n=1 Tax=Ideonella sp. TaxID=1929293 RepID=UPI002CC58FB2|nr:hypothetical protein [Ideonella sp.]HSI47687.1 hypothetical protein [Ideonella sp.]
MHYTTIACLDDLSRDAFWPAKEFMYDLIRVPVFHATGMDLGKSPRRGQRHNLKPGFDTAHFLRLCGAGSGPHDWAALYLGIPAPAADYLNAHVPEGALIVGYEMPAWLRQALDQGGHAWLDMRLSPLRFASDLYMALGTNQPDLYARLLPHAQRMDEVFSEASLMAAQVRYRQRYDESAGPYDGAWIYIGQTEADASLINPQGRFARVADHAATLRQLAGNERLAYKPHPLAHGFAAAEHQQLERIVGRAVPLCEAETYELMAGERPVRFVGLSSGVLQEAQWFGKEAVSLMAPICQPAFQAEHGPEAYLQIASHDFLSEPMWAAALNPEAPRAQPLRHPPRPNHLRELHNTWWGYASHTARHSDFHRQVFALHGSRRDDGASSDTMRQALTQAHHQIDTLRQEVDGLKDALRVVMRQTATRATRAERPAGLRVNG